MIKKLLQIGADANAKYYGETPLHLAITLGKADVVKALIIDGNADLTLKNDAGKTPVDAGKALAEQDLGEGTLEGQDYGSKITDILNKTIPDAEAERIRNQSMD